ncbi:MAG: recombinase family protein [Pseudomonas sp.]|nr:recombinase family protein [Pseudomonas sp.]
MPIFESQPLSKTLSRRVKQSLINFAADHNQRIASFYIENESGATLYRPKLMELISDAEEGDIILVEQIDLLARLKSLMGKR